MTDDWTALCVKLSSLGYEEMSQPEQVWVSVRSLIDAVENGGCISYFYNGGADHLDECRSALNTLGAASVLRELETVCSLFGKHVPRDIDERNEIISSWPDGGAHEAVMERADEALTELMYELEEKLSAFVDANVRQSNNSLQADRER